MFLRDGAGIWPAMVLVVAGVVVSAWHGVAYTELAVVAGRPRSAPPWAWATVACSWSFFLTAQAIPPLLQWQGWPAVWIGTAGGAAGGSAVPAAGSTRAPTSYPDPRIPKKDRS
jgi:hypothetical protein